MAFQCSAFPVSSRPDHTYTRDGTIESNEGRARELPASKASEAPFPPLRCSLCPLHIQVRADKFPLPKSARTRSAPWTNSLSVHSRVISTQLVSPMFVPLSNTLSFKTEYGGAVHLPCYRFSPSFGVFIVSGIRWPLLEKDRTRCSSTASDTKVVLLRRRGSDGQISVCSQCR